MSDRTGISEAIHYSGSKSYAVEAEIDRYSLTPSNGNEIGASFPLQFLIPTGSPGQFLKPNMSYLSFQINNNNANAIPFRISNSALSFFQRARVLHGGSVISDTADYNVLTSMLLDLQTGAEFNNSLAFSGRETDKLITQNTVNVNVGQGDATAASGGADDARVADCRLGSYVAATGTLDVVVPLLACGPLAPSANRYIPLFALGTPLMLELTTVSSTNTPVISVEDDTISNAGAIRTNNVTADHTWTLRNFRYNFATMTLDPSIVNAIERVNYDGGFAYIINGHNWYTGTGSVPAGNTADAFVLPFNQYKSLETILFSFRDSDHQAARFGNNLARANRNLKNYQFSVAGKLVPSTLIEGFPNMFYELQKAWHQLYDTNVGMNISKRAYEVAEYRGDGAFIGGMDFTSFSHKSDVLRAGLDTVGKQVMLNTQYTGGAAHAHTMHAFAHFAARYIIDQNKQMSTDS